MRNKLAIKAHARANNASWKVELAAKNTLIKSIRNQRWSERWEKTKGEQLQN